MLKWTNLLEFDTISNRKATLAGGLLCLTAPCKLVCVPYKRLLISYVAFLLERLSRRPLQLRVL